MTGDGFTSLMKIALDGTPLTVSSDGIARYTAELSLALAAEFPTDELLLVSDQWFAMPSGAPPNLARGSGPRNALERRWWSWGLPRELGRRQVSVFHGTAFSVPYLPLRPSVLSLHDLSPWMNPEWHASAARTRRRAPLLMGLGLATLVITDTEAVRRQAIDVFRLHPGRVTAVPLAASSRFRLVPQPPPATPYLLYAGTLEPRKNIPMLLEAWREVARSHAVHLFLAGRRRPDFPPLAEEPGLRLLGEVTDPELASLYSGATAFVYPSAYEGFGLPVLEAMQCGAPVIASRDPATVETAGDAAVFVDSGDTKGWVEAIGAVLSNPGMRQTRRERGLRRALEFSWSRAARQTHEVYGEAILRFGR